MNDSQYKEIINRLDKLERLIKESTRFSKEFSTNILADLLVEIIKNKL